MTRDLLRVCAFALFLSPAAISAQERTNDEVVEHNFDDADEVFGGTVTPYSELISGRIRLPRHSLVRLRTTFVVEMLKSVEDL